MVLRAFQPRLRRHVAVKLLIPGSKEATAGVVAALRRLDARCTHPAVVGFDTCGTSAGGLPYVVMEFMEGGSLADHLAQRRSPPGPRAVEIIARVADAVDHAHQAGVLHRNIKPANILLTGSGIPKLTDFWIDGQFGETGGTAAAQAATLRHTAPEVLEGGEPSPAADVFSLASTLSVLLAESAPSPLGPEAPAPAVVSAAAAAAELRGRGVPVAVCDVLEQALARDPGARPTSAAEFAYLLRRAARAAAKAAPDAASAASVGGSAGTAVAEAPGGKAPATEAAVVEATATVAPAAGRAAVPPARSTAGRPPGRPAGRPRRRALRRNLSLWGAILLIVTSLALATLAILAWREVGPFALPYAGPDWTIEATTTTGGATTAPSTTAVITTTETTTTTTAPTTTTTRPPTTTTTTVQVRVSVNPASGPPEQTFVVTATGLTRNGSASITITQPGGGVAYSSTQTADGSGACTWYVGSSAGDPAGTYAITVVDATSGRRGYGSFSIT